MSTQENRHSKGHADSEKGILPADIKTEFLNSLKKNTVLTEKTDTAEKGNSVPEKISLFDKRQNMLNEDEPLSGLNSDAKSENNSQKEGTTSEAPSLFNEKNRKNFAARNESKRKNAPGKKLSQQDNFDSRLDADALTEGKAEKSRKPLKNGKIPMVKAIFFVMLVPSIILLLLPFSMKIGTTVTYLLVSFFWLSLLFTGITMFVLKILYSGNINALYGKTGKVFRIYRFLSVFNFFRNKSAVMADAGFMVMIVALIIVLILSSKMQTVSTYVVPLFFSLFLLSLNYHVYFNDSIYEYNLKIKSDKKDVVDNE